MIKVDKLSSRAINNITYDHRPSFSGIVAGECKGDMWVNDIEDPKIALVYSFAVVEFSILGEPADAEVYNSFKTFMVEKMFCELKSRGINYFEFSIESEKAKPYILDAFKIEALFVADKTPWTVAYNRGFIGEMLEGLNVSLERSALKYLEYIFDGHAQVMHPGAIEAYNYLKGMCK